MSGPPWLFPAAVSQARFLQPVGAPPAQLQGLPERGGGHLDVLSVHTTGAFTEINSSDSKPSKAGIIEPILTNEEIMVQEVYAVCTQPQR